MNIIIWREDFYILPIDGVCRDVDFYQDMVSQLVPHHIRFHLYHLYLVWDELEAKLAGTRKARFLSSWNKKILKYF